MTTVRLEVTGRVQGVGFRWFVREIARRADVSGWVKNLPNGSVEIAASGPDTAIAELVAAARRGPPGSHVQGVAELSTVGLGELPRPFAVVRDW